MLSNMFILSTSDPAQFGTLFRKEASSSLGKLAKESFAYLFEQRQPQLVAESILLSTILIS
jgi:hypothetical protein